MSKQHEYTTSINWTGDRGQGNTTYQGYDRSWTIQAPGKPIVHCSNDPLLGGDPSRMNPEDLLLSALSACHMLWYLHLAHKAGVIVHGYADSPTGVGENEASGAGRFVRAILKPVITLAAGTDESLADSIHHDIHDYCFIARSVNFPVLFEAVYKNV